jgi:hypothetical protein
MLDPTRIRETGCGDRRQPREFLNPLSDSVFSSLKIGVTQPLTMPKGISNDEHEGSYPQS